MKDFRSDNLINSIERENSSLFRSFATKIVSFILIIFMIFGIFPCNPFMHIDAPIAPLAVKANAEFGIVLGYGNQSGAGWSYEWQGNGQGTLTLNGYNGGSMRVAYGVSNLTIVLENGSNNTISGGGGDAFAAGQNKSLNWKDSEAFWDCSVTIKGDGFLFLNAPNGEALYVRGNLTTYDSTRVRVFSGPTHPFLVTGAVNVEGESLEYGTNSRYGAFTNGGIHGKSGSSNIKIDGVTYKRTEGKTYVVQNVNKSKKYEKFSDALNEVEDNETLKLLMDISDSFTLKSKSFTIDANGKSFKGKINISSAANISLKGGTFNNVTVDNDGNVKIIDGTYNSVDIKGTAEITGGTFNNYTFTSRAILSGGVYKAKINNKPVNPKDKGATIKDDYRAVTNSNNEYIVELKPVIVEVNGTQYREYDKALAFLTTNTNNFDLKYLKTIDESDIRERKTTSLDVVGSHTIDLNNNTVIGQLSININNDSNLLIKSGNFKDEVTINQNSGLVTFTSVNFLEGAVYNFVSGTSILENVGYDKKKLVVGDNTDSINANLIITGTNGSYSDIEVKKGAHLLIKDGKFNSVEAYSATNIEIQGGRYKFKPNKEYIDDNNYMVSYKDEYYVVSERIDCAYINGKEETKFKKLDLAIASATDNATIILIADTDISNIQVLTFTNLTLDMGSSNIYAEMPLFVLSGTNLTIKGTDASIYTEYQSETNYTIDVLTGSNLTVDGTVEIGSSQSTIHSLANNNIAIKNGATIYSNSIDGIPLDINGSLTLNNANIENKNKDNNNFVINIFSDSPSAEINLIDSNIIGKKSYFSDTLVEVKISGTNFSSNNDDTLFNSLTNIVTFNSITDICIDSIVCDKSCLEINNCTNIDINGGIISYLSQTDGKTTINGGVFESIDLTSSTNNKPSFVEINGGYFPTNVIKNKITYTSINTNKYQCIQVNSGAPNGYNGYYLVRVRPNMVQISGTNLKFNNLDDAFKASQNGDTLLIIENSDLPSNLTGTNLNITIEFDGHELQEDITTLAFVNSNVKLVDSKNTSDSVIYPSIRQNGGVLSFENIIVGSSENGLFDIENGKVNADNSVFNFEVDATKANISLDSSKLNCLSVTNRSIITADNSSQIANLKINDHSKATINDSKIDNIISCDDSNNIVALNNVVCGDANIESAVIDIADSTFENELNILNNVEAYINSGTFNGNISVKNNSSLDILSGEFNGNVSSGLSEIDTSIINISNGVFKANTYYSSNTSIDITGGVFTIEPDREIINKDYMPKKENDGYHIVYRPYVAQIYRDNETIDYRDFDTAFKALQSGDRIKIFDDLDIEKTLEFNDKIIKFDLAGKTINSQVDSLFKITSNSDITFINSSLSKAYITYNGDVSNNYLIAVDGNSTLEILDDIVIDTKFSAIVNESDSKLIISNVEIYAENSAVVNYAELSINNSIVSHTNSGSGTLISNAIGNTNQVTINDSIIGDGPIYIGEHSNVTINGGTFYTTNFDVKEDVSSTDRNNVVITSGMFRFDPTSYTDLTKYAVVKPNAEWYKVINADSYENLPVILSSTDFNIWINGVTVTNQNYNKWDENNWGYNPETNTLVLRNFVFNASSSIPMIQYKNSLNINLIGENIISNSNYAIKSIKETPEITNTDVVLNIYGTGSLETNGGIANTNLTGCINIDNVTVNINANTEYGILASKKIKFDGDSKVNLSGNNNILVSATNIEFGETNIVANNSNIGFNVSTPTNLVVNSEVTIAVGTNDADLVNVKESDYIQKLKESKYIKIGTIAKYGVYVDGIEVNSYVTSGDGWTFDVDNTVLVLNYYSSTDDSGYVIPGNNRKTKIYSNEDLTIKLIGSNNIFLSDSNYKCDGIYVASGNLKLIGDGSLNITATNYGMNCPGNISIDNCEIKVSSSDIALKQKSLTIPADAAIYTVNTDGEEAEIQRYNNENYVYITFPKNYYGVVVDGTEIIAANAGDVFGDGHVSYDKENATLLLNGFSGSYITTNEHASISQLKIYLSGTNKLSAKDRPALDFTDVDYIYIDSNASGQLMVGATGDGISAICANNICLYKGLLEIENTNKNLRAYDTLTDFSIPYDSEIYAIIDENLKTTDYEEFKNQINSYPESYIRINALNGHQHIFNRNAEYIWIRNTTATDYKATDYSCIAYIHCFDNDCDCYECAEAKISLLNEEQCLYIAEFDDPKFDSCKRVIVNDAAYLITDGESLTVKMNNPLTTITNIAVNNGKPINDNKCSITDQSFYRVVVTTLEGEDQEKNYTLALNNTLKYATTYSCDTTGLENAIGEAEKILSRANLSTRTDIETRVVYDGKQLDDLYVDSFYYDIFKDELDTARSLLLSANGNIIDQVKIDNEVNNLFNAKKNLIGNSGISNIVVSGKDISLAKNDDVTIVSAEYIDESGIYPYRDFDNVTYEHKILSEGEELSFKIKGSGIWTFKITEEIYGIQNTYMEYVVITDINDETCDTVNKVLINLLQDLIDSYSLGGELYNPDIASSVFAKAQIALRKAQAQPQYYIDAAAEFYSSVMMTQSKAEIKEKQIPDSINIDVTNEIVSISGNNASYVLVSLGECRSFDDMQSVGYTMVDIKKSASTGEYVGTYSGAFGGKYTLYVEYIDGTYEMKYFTIEEDIKPLIFDTIQEDGPITFRFVGGFEIESISYTYGNYEKISDIKDTELLKIKDGRISVEPFGTGPHSFVIKAKFNGISDTYIINVSDVQCSKPHVINENGVVIASTKGFDDVATVAYSKGKFTTWTDMSDSATYIAKDKMIKDSSFNDGVYTFAFLDENGICKYLVEKTIKMSGEK